MKLLLSRQEIVFSLLLLIAVIPCFAHGSFVYVSNYSDGTISQFRANRNGTLTTLNPSCVKAYPRCHSLAVAQGCFLYALSSLEFSRRDCLVSQFRIGADGRLRPLSPATVSVPYNGQGGGPFLVTAEPSGRFVYVPGRDGTIAQFRIQKDGTLGLLKPPLAAGSRFSTGDDCHIAYDRSHSMLYVSGYGHMMIDAFGQVQSYHIEANGSLHLLPKSYINTIVRDLCVPRGDRFAYLPYYYRDDRHAEEISTIISEYRTTSQGTLVPLRKPQVSLTGMASHTLTDPHGALLYLTIPDEYWVYGKEFNQRRVSGNFLERCKIRTNGTLKRCPWQVLRVQADVAAAEFDPKGQFLYLLTGNGIRPFRVRPTGSVASLSPGSIRAGHGPLGMVYVHH